MAMVGMVYNRPMIRVLLLMVALAGTSWADDKAAARIAAREGQRLLDVGEYQAALDAFKRAYLAGEEPRLLFDIAECHRYLGNKTEAARVYQNYLRKAPDADNRAEVEALIKELGGAPAKASPRTAPTIVVQPAPVALQPAPVVVQPAPVQQPAPVLVPAARPAAPPAARAPQGSVYNPWGARPVSPAETKKIEPETKKIEPEAKKSGPEEAKKPAAEAKPKKDEPKKAAPARSWTDF
jgi:tetratricopeptide (TPR) repeat protein